MPEPAAQGHRARLTARRAEPAAGLEPTLPELLRSSRLGRAIGLVLVVLVLALAALFLFGRGGGSFSYEGSEAPPFSISWGGELKQVRPLTGDLLSLRGQDGELAIRPLPPAALSAGDAAEPLAELGLEAERQRGRIEALPGAHVVLEGRTELAVDRGPEAYQLGVVVPRKDGSVLIGKRFFVPDPDRPGDGVQIEITEATSNPRVIEKVERAPAGFFANWPIQLLLEDAVSVRTEEALEEPLRSFEFG